MGLDAVEQCCGRLAVHRQTIFLLVAPDCRLSLSPKPAIGCAYFVTLALKSHLNVPDRRRIVVVARAATHRSEMRRGARPVCPDSRRLDPS
jgi:hypothetical protein